MLCERRTATNLYYNYHKLNQQNPEDMPYAKLLMGSYFGISVFTLNWTVITDTLDMTSIYYLKNNELISLVYICSEIQLQLLPVIERTFTLKIICSQDVKIKNDVAIFIIAIWQDISIECQKFISSLFIAMNWIYWWIKLWRGRDINI